MFRILFSITTLFLGITAQIKADVKVSNKNTFESDQDSLTLIEIDQYWQALSKTVENGNHEAYEALYHPDAVVVFATGKNKSSVSIKKAMIGWRQGFMDTKAGKVNSKVEFRLSQRINDENTAHETGIFRYTSGKGKAEDQSSYVHFEMLLVKRDNKWVGMMEYQKSIATKEEWDALNRSY